MDKRLYNKAVTCPVCSKEFEITKFRSNGIKVASRDTDFCVYYEDFNPLFYDIWVCEHCGYAAQSEKFDSILFKETKIILETIKPRWTSRSFAGERTVDSAIETFKLALYNLHVRKAKSSELAKICLRLAWLYRLKKDEREFEYLNYALKSYNEAFEKERFPIDKLDEFTCMYIIAELQRRLGNYGESVRWFSKLVGSPDARRNTKLIEAAREQYLLAKEQLDTQGQTAAAGSN